jgi:hypothetical protein
MGAPCPGIRRPGGEADHHLHLVTRSRVEFRVTRTPQWPVQGQLHLLPLYLLRSAQFRVPLAVPLGEAGDSGLIYLFYPNNAVHFAKYVDI